MLHESRKIYLSFDNVHLIKNVRKNLLNHKRFLFPSFTFNGLKDSIKKAPKLTLKVLHPGSNKKHVPLALAIFDETTSAVIQSYFPQHLSTAEFLQWFQKWWIISNSKSQFSTTNDLGNSAVLGDEKPAFLRAFAAWLRGWQQERISNCERFTLTSQTAPSFTRKLLCHTSLIEDLPEEGYEFVLPSRFQSGPIEQRFAQYQQMSGERFIAGLKDVNRRKKIMQIKSLLKEEVDIDNSVKDTVDNDEKPEHLLQDVDYMNCSTDNVALSENSREVSCHIAGNIARKLKKRYGS